MGFPAKDFRRVAGVPKSASPFAPYRNRWEKQYAEYLEIRRRAGEIDCWEYESVRVKVGNGAWFKPDFIVRTLDGQIQFHETKGFAREAAMVRIRAAALRFPYFQFFIVKKDKGSWVEKRI